MRIELPWPPSTLSGHNNGHWRGKSSIVAKHREWAMNAALAAKLNVHSEGDIRVSVTFYPPNNRGDRVNFPNRCKPYFDGLADALKVNDRRFLPTYHFAEPVRNPRVVIVIDPPVCSHCGRTEDVTPFVCGKGGCPLGGDQ